MGFFSKKEVRAPAPARARPAPKPAPIAITGVGLACHAGDQPFELICSILGQVSGLQLSDEYKIMSNNGTYIVPRMAPIEALGEMPDRERMYQLTKSALSNAASQLSSGVKSESVLIVIVVNPEQITRFKKIDTQHLQGYLSENIARLEPAAFRILPKDKGSSTGALRSAIAELGEGKWQAIIFGGADSLISIYTCQDLLRDDRLSAIGHTEGIIPGEGAAFILLQSADTAAKNTTPPLAYLRGTGVAPEPHARDADTEPTEGLSNAIGQALTQAGMAAPEIQGIVHNLGAETVQAIEWYQTTKKTWPRRVSEQQRVAVQLGEIEQADTPDDPLPKIILPYMTMGELGAAALPMQLATALAWLEYDAHHEQWGFPARKQLLVCDTPDAPERGAMVVSATLATTT